MTLPIEITLKVSATIAVGLTASALLHGRSAALRHWILAAAVAAAAMMPLLQAAVPAWQVPGSRETVASPSFGVFPAVAGRPATAAGPRRPVARTNAAQALADSAAPLGRLSAVFLVWIIGALWSLAVLVMGLVRLRHIASWAAPIDRGPWRETCDSLVRAFGIRRPVVLLQSDHPTLLVTWGARRPRILLPAGAGGWPSSRVAVVLAHELAHVGRADWVALLLALLVRAAYWFNPLVWIACARMRRESELACDDAVLERGVEPPEYATVLVDLARHLTVGRRSFLPAPAIVVTSFLEKRIAAMLNRHVNRTPITGKLRGLIAVFMLGLAGAVASAQMTFATVSGVLTDQTGGVLPGATVTLTHLATGTKHEQRTDATGAYRLTGLTSGDYQLEVSIAGFATYKREGLTLSPGQTAAVNIQMRVGSLQETITVVDSDEPAASPKQAPAKLSGPPATCQAGAVGGNIKVPRKVLDVRPRYPLNLRPSRAEGVVNMEAVIGVDGRIKDVNVISSPNADMAESAVAAVRQWEYTPTLLNCTPIDVNMTVSVAFNAMR